MLSAALAALAAGGLFLTGGAEARHDGPAATQGATSNLAAQTVQVRDFTYSPASFNATVGDPMTVTVTNAGPAPHTFTISGVADSGQIPAGQTRTVQFTPARAGDLTFFCTVHGQAVMSGRISVASATASPAQPAPQQPAPPPAQPPQQVPAQPRPAVMQPPSTGDAGLLGLTAD
jgi:plastocyanin